MKRTLLITALLFSIILSHAQWQIVTQNIGNGFTARTDIEIAPDGTIYIAYLSYSGGTYFGNVKKYTGSDWEAVGSIIFEMSVYWRFDLEIDSDGTLYMAYNDESTGERKMSVKKFNGSDWELVGAQGFSDGEIQFPQMAFDNNNVPYVVYRDFANGHGATVQKYNGSNWELVGEAAFTSGGAWCTSIILDQNNVPYVAFQDWTNGQKISVNRFVDEQWELVGSAGFSIGQAWTTDIKVDANNIPYVIYNDQGDNDNSYLKKWNESTWETVGGESVSDNAGLDANFEFDAENDIYVAFQDYSVSQAPASVKKLVDNNWEYLGEAGFAATNCRFTSIAIDSIGSIFIAYVEMYNGQSLIVAEYPQEITYMPTVSSSDFLIYPNPTNGIVNIKTEKYLTNPEIIITNIVGKIIIKTDNFQIDMIENEKGLYFVTLKDKKNIFTKPLLLN